MGGGDLNLKKSWHPHTLKNQEKVWKAEQAKTQEDKKLCDLRKEIADEKNREELKRLGEASGVLARGDGDKKLEWMYKNSNELINREEYLLGRTIDKSFEILQSEEQRKDKSMVGMKQSVNHVEHEVIPFSIRSYRNMESTEQVDLQRKVMEDPLMLIKQREMESRRKLLENPVKLKELHRILKTDQMLKNEKKSKKSKKSKRKHKKRSKSSSASDNTDSGTDSSKNLDKELEKRYKKLKGSLLNKEEHLDGLNLTKLLDAKYETISKELDKAAETKKKTKSSHRNHSGSDDASDYGSTRKCSGRDADQREHSRSPPRDHYRRRSRSYSPARRQQYQRRYESTRDHNERNNQRPSSPVRRQYTRFPAREQRTRSPAREQRARSTTYKRKRSPAKYTATRKESPENKRERFPAKNTSAPLKEYTGRTKLTEEEKEARRREMMENANWREVDRTTAVQKHRDAYAREEEQNKARDFDKEFINKEVKKAIANQTSVGSRIRSNLNNIQRTSAAMNSNFARK